MSAELLMFTCFGCGQPASACPECVVTIQVDPVTGMPPDVAVVNGHPVSVAPTVEATARSEKVAICDNCVKVRNDRTPGSAPWATSEETHRRRHL